MKPSGWSTSWSTTRPSTRFQPFEDITETEFRRQSDTNVLGSILVIQQYLRQVSPHGGSIIIISTAGITTNNPGSALYTSTKSAQTTLARVLANEVAARKSGSTPSRQARPTPKAPAR